MSQCECSRCGTFAFETYVGSDFQGSPKQVANASRYIREHQNIGLHDEDVLWLKSLPTPTVAEKSLSLLRGIASEAPKAGSNVRIQVSSMQPQFNFALREFSYDVEDNNFENACFAMFRWLGYAGAEDAAELAFIVQCVLVNELHYLSQKVPDLGEDYEITGRGWQTLADAERTGSASDIAFVGMSFDESLLTAYRDAIQPAIKAAGYKVDRLDHTKHNEEIVHKILADIRRSNFVVVDLTLQNHGAYFEAGFAMGLGRPIIRTVREDELQKVHFDQRQYNFLRWEQNDLPQFRHDLQQWIEATVGRGPVPPSTNVG
jgi:nucleoside 2-deoxyribosyltransferase